jgi:hypothetical protein
MATHLELDDVVLLGRTLDEYQRMFDLDEAILKSATILDMASGVSSFCAEANALGYRVTAADRIYQFGADEIEAKCRVDLERVMGALPEIEQNYVWEIYEDVAALTRQREMAYRRFVSDYRVQGTSRYVLTELPLMGFEDGEFDVVLVSHLLFLYEEQLSYEFHRESLRELLRVGGEVRIFPLVNLRTEVSSYVTLLRGDEAFAEYVFEVRDVDYEFIRNGNQMLVVQGRPDYCNLR